MAIKGKTFYVDDPMGVDDTLGFRAALGKLGGKDTRFFSGKDVHGVFVLSKLPRGSSAPEAAAVAAAAPRSRRMVQAQPGAESIVEMARARGIPVYEDTRYVDSVLRLARPQDAQGARGHGGVSRPLPASMRRPPPPLPANKRYVAFDDLSPVPFDRQYKELDIGKTDWARNFRKTTQPRLAKSYEVFKRKMETRDYMSMEVAYIPPHKDAIPGYCENCHGNYTDYRIHLTSTAHRDFMNNRFRVPEVVKANDLGTLPRDISVWPEHVRAPLRAMQDFASYDLRDYPGGKPLFLTLERLSDEGDDSVVNGKGACETEGSIPCLSGALGSADGDEGFVEDGGEGDLAPAMEPEQPASSGANETPGGADPQADAGAPSSSGSGVLIRTEPIRFSDVPVKDNEDKESEDKESEDKESEAVNAPPPSSFDGIPSIHSPGASSDSNDAYNRPLESIPSMPPQSASGPRAQSASLPPPPPLPPLPPQSLAPAPDTSDAFRTPVKPAAPARAVAVVSQPELPATLPSSALPVPAPPVPITFASPLPGFVTPQRNAVTSVRASAPILVTPTVKKEENPAVLSRSAPVQINLTRGVPATSAISSSGSSSPPRPSAAAMAAAEEVAAEAAAATAAEAAAEAAAAYRTPKANKSSVQTPRRARPTPSRPVIQPSLLDPPISRIIAVRASAMVLASSSSSSSLSSSSSASSQQSSFSSSSSSSAVFTPSRSSKPKARRQASQPNKTKKSPRQRKRRLAPTADTLRIVDEGLDVSEESTDDSYASKPRGTKRQRTESCERPVTRVGIKRAPPTSKPWSVKCEESLNLTVEVSPSPAKKRRPLKRVVKEEEEEEDEDEEDEEDGRALKQERSPTRGRGVEGNEVLVPQVIQRKKGKAMFCSPQGARK